MADQDFDFEKLVVYQKTMDYIHHVFEIYKMLPKEFQRTIGDNLVRAGMSIANNIAEGSGKKFKKEKLRYYSISLDSTRECISVFNVLFRGKLIAETLYQRMRAASREIASMMCGLIKALETAMNR